MGVGFLLDRSHDIFVLRVTVAHVCENLSFFSLLQPVEDCDDRLEYAVPFLLQISSILNSKTRIHSD